MENAETFLKVDFCRICELSAGDFFMWQGTWFIVEKITEEKVRYKNKSNPKAGKYTLGKNSKQFVQVVKKQNS